MYKKTNLVLRKGTDSSQMYCPQSFVLVLTDWVVPLCDSGVQRRGVPAADRDGASEPPGGPAAEEGDGGGRSLRHPGADVRAQDALGQPG